MIKFIKLLFKRLLFVGITLYIGIIIGISSTEELYSKLYFDCGSGGYTF